MRRGSNTYRNACVCTDASPRDRHNLGRGVEEVSDVSQVVVVVRPHVGDSHVAPSAANGRR
jgi:hypothetical protein